MTIGVDEGWAVDVITPGQAILKVVSVSSKAIGSRSQTAAANIMAGWASSEDVGGRAGIAEAQRRPSETAGSLYKSGMDNQPIAFGPFVFDKIRGTLHWHGSPVALGPRALALLRVLLEADGKVVTRAELMDAAWPNMSVEESNLTVQIASLRKSLGSDGSARIATVPRVGYRFVRKPGNMESPSLPVTGSATIEVPCGKLSIAVLPFNNTSSDQEQEYFADGISEDLITDLSKVPGLLVIARNSSFAYKGKSVDIRLIARELGIRYVIQGSVRRAGARVRINAQLVDAVDNGHLWADRFDRDLADIFALQDEVVSRIVSALSAVLPMGKPIPTNRAKYLEAYDLLVRGRVLVTESRDANRAARPLFEKSIRLDPGFAEAHAWLAINHAFGWLFWGEPVESYTLGIAAARRAVLLDPSNAEAHAILGTLLVFDGNLVEAARELATALQINSNHADAWTFLAELKVSEGNAEEAVESVRTAFRLNPHPPGRYYWYLGYAQYAAGHYEEAVETLRHESTHRTGSQRILAAALAQLGRVDEAKDEAREFLAANSHFTVTHWVATQHFEKSADRQHFIDGYLAAGLPM